MGETISLKMHKDLLRTIDDIAATLNLSRSEWIRTTLAHAAKTEMVQNKIMDITANYYLDGKISFEEIVNLLGYENAKRIEAVAKGVEKSIQEADDLASKLKKKSDI